MRKPFFLVFLALLAISTFAGCGGGGSGDSSPSNLFTGSAPPPEPEPQAPAQEVKPPAQVILASSLPAGTNLSQGGEATITAWVKDSSGQAVVDGTIVSFECTLGYIPPTASTSGGKATVTFTADTTAGDVYITATSTPITSTPLLIQVVGGEAASIVKESVNPATIGVAGSGLADTSRIDFRIKDANGNAAPDGTVVNLSIPVPIGGGEKLLADEVTSAGGIGTVYLRTGNAAGTVSVIASITTSTGEVISSEVARVTIVSNRPDAGRFSLAASTLNLAGGVTYDLESTISAYLGDRAGNVVPDGTPVSFISECGRIGNSSGFTATTTSGVATAVLRTSAPTVPNLGGIGNIGNPGYCKVVAYTPGKGTFLDMDGDGQFDSGVDQCTTDMSEPYMDANDNGQYDAGEYYVDADGSGSFNEDAVDCLNDSMIWASMDILNSGPAASLNLNPTTFDIPLGGSQLFTVDFQDVYGNALVGGTTFTVTTDAGKIAGGGLVQGDMVGPGQTFTFALLADATGELKSAKITVTIGPAPGSNNNGAAVTDYAYGTINRP